MTAEDTRRLSGQQDLPAGLGDDELDRGGTDYPALPDYGFEGQLICGEAPNVIAARPDEFTREQVSPDDR